MTGQEQQDRLNRIANMKDFVEKAGKSAANAHSILFGLGIGRVDIEGLCPELKGYDRQKTGEVQSWLYDAMCLLDVVANDEKLLARLADYYRMPGDPKRLSLPWNKTEKSRDSL
jgi:hypothetical protein